jgi:AcrR family transcriptional regulator
VPGKRSAHERLPELIGAAVRVFIRDGYRSARMSDVATEMGLSEAAIYRYVESKEGLFVLAIRHALLLEDLPGGDLPLSPAPLSVTMKQAREYVASVVPFGYLAGALAQPVVEDPAAELEAILRETFTLESRTREAADMIERSARELPELADLRHRFSDPYGAAIPADVAEATVVDTLVHALVPAQHLAARG